MESFCGLAEIHGFSWDFGMNVVTRITFSFSRVKIPLFQMTMFFIDVFSFSIFNLTGLDLVLGSWISQSGHVQGHMLYFFKRCCTF